MARDETLLHDESLRPAALRIYAWTPPTISLGYFQRHAQLAALPPALRGLAVVRRCTGGGAILHDREVTYCLVLDESIDVARKAPHILYSMVHECWRAALADAAPQAALAPDSFPLPTPRDGPFFCFERPGRADLLLHGEKLLGSAQRRLPGRVLQHGSLLLAQRFAAHPGTSLGGPSPELVATWVDRFVGLVATGLGLTPAPGAWSDRQLEDAAGRRRTYAGDDWTMRR